MKSLRKEIRWQVSEQVYRQVQWQVWDQTWGQVLWKVEGDLHEKA